MKFNYYSNNVKSSQPLGVITLSQFVRAIKQPKAQVKEALLNVKKSKDEKEKAYYKQHLYYFTPSVIVNGRRRYKDIVAFTGIAPLDFDKLSSESLANQFKNYIFNEYPFIITAFKSSSGLGVRALVAIPQVNTIGDYKAFYKGIEQEFNQYIGFDTAPKNAVLPLFISYDPDILYRQDYTTFNTYIAEEAHQVDEIHKLPDTNEDIKRLMQNIINKIHDNGHPQLRSAARLLGGFVANDYITQTEAEELIIALIHNNAYLSSGLPKKPYLQTAMQSIKHGKLNPVTL